MSTVTTHQMHSKTVLDVVTFHCVGVLHDFSSEDQTQLLGLGFKLLRNERFKLQRKEKKLKWNDD